MEGIGRGPVVLYVAQETVSTGNVDVLGVGAAVSQAAAKRLKIGRAHV